MSAAAIGSTTPDLYSILQQINAQTQSQTPAAAAASSSSTDAATDTSTSIAPTPHRHHGHHGVPSQIESAVATALQNAEPGSDPNQTIQTAIEDALQKAADGQQNGSVANSSGNSETSTAAPSPTDTGSLSDANAANFNSLLSSFGVDPKQFQTDFQSALQSLNQNGAVNFASLFKNFPPGSAVDTLA